MLKKYLLYAIFVCFIAGQFLDLFLPIHLLDVAVCVFVILSLPALFSRKIPYWGQGAVSFVFAGAVALGLYGQITEGSLYLARLAVYMAFALGLYTYVRERDKAEIAKALGLVGFVVALLGIGQYLLVPDTRYLYFFGWDDHYFRLIGSYLDPAFTGIILVLSALVILNFKKTSKFWLVALGTVLLALLFTYSRSSILAFVLGASVLAYFSKKTIFVGASVLIFLLGIFLLPTTPGGEGVNLGRTASGYAKAENAVQTVDIAKSSPVLGVGFNNLCDVKVHLGLVDSDSHACAGADNSYLFILATVGVVGFIIFLRILYEVGISTNLSYRPLLYSSGLAVGVHALFTNTIFYIFVLAWLAILIAISRTKESK